MCQLLNSVGEQLDHERARSWMDSYFLRLENVNQGDALPARIKFMIQDVCENRAARWRKRQQSDGPKKLDTSNSQASASGNRGSAAGATLVCFRFLLFSFFHLFSSCCCYFEFRILTCASSSSFALSIDRLFAALWRRPWLGESVEQCSPN